MVIICVVLLWIYCCVLYVSVLFGFFFFKQKTAYEMRISDWSSDVCSSDLMTTQNPVVRTAVWRNLLAGRENREECGRGAGNLLQQPRRLRAEIGRASCRERVCQYV